MCGYSWIQTSGDFLLHSTYAIVLCGTLHCCGSFVTLVEWVFVDKQLVFILSKDTSVKAPLLSKLFSLLPLTNRNSSLVVTE